MKFLAILLFFKNILTIEIDMFDGDEMKEIYLRDQDKLMKHLFDNYDNRVAPVLRLKLHNLTLTRWKLEVRILRLKVIDLDEPREQLSVSLHTVQTWKDVRFKWNPKKHDNIFAMYVRQDTVWTPPLEVFSASDAKEHRDPVFRIVQVHNGGWASTHSSLSLTTNCKLQMSDFPFDTQQCDIRSGLALMSSHFVKIITIFAKKEKANFCEMGNSAWDVIDVRTGNVTLDSEFYYHADTVLSIIRITLKRNPFFYMYMIVLPTFIINLIAIGGVFLRKATPMETLTIGLTHIMTMTFILGLIAEQIPKTEEVPLLGIYIISGLCEMFIGMVASTIIKIAKQKSRTIELLIFFILELSNLLAFFYMIYRYLDFQKGHGIRGDCSVEEKMKRITVFQMDD